VNEPAQGPGQIGDVDWEGERRWKDDHPVLSTVGGMLASWLVLAGVYWLVKPTAQVPASAWVVSVIGCVGGIVGALRVSARARSRIADELGLTPRQLPVLGRRLRKEWIPADPWARWAVGALAQRQFRQLRRTRWLWPVMIVVYGFNAVLHVANSPRDGFTWFWVALAASSLPTPFLRFRSQSRLERVLAELGRDGEPALIG